MLYNEKYQDHIPCSFAFKVFCIENKFSKKVKVIAKKNKIKKIKVSIK